MSASAAFSIGTTVVFFFLVALSSSTLFSPSLCNENDPPHHGGNTTTQNSGGEKIVDHFAIYAAELPQLKPAIDAYILGPSNADEMVQVDPRIILKLLGEQANPNEAAGEIQSSKLGTELMGILSKTIKYCRENALQYGEAATSLLAFAEEEYAKVVAKSQGQTGKKPLRVHIPSDVAQSPHLNAWTFAKATHNGETGTSTSSSTPTSPNGGGPLSRRLSQSPPISPHTRNPTYRHSGPRPSIGSPSTSPLLPRHTSSIDEAAAMELAEAAARTTSCGANIHSHHDSLDDAAPPSPHRLESFALL